MSPMVIGIAGCEALVGAAVVGVTPVVAAGAVGASVNAVNPVDRVEPELAAALIARVPIYANDDPAVAQGERVGDATAMSCERMPGDPPASQEDALIKLRLQAERQGANAVVLANCDERGNLSFTKNCYSWVRCRG